ncbi:hypothetical protein K3495_g4718 [Podosphaera aphanis]|nr:hypothetical protein K3495_g4718 [Podosphaera aphanis]
MSDNQDIKGKMESSQTIDWRTEEHKWENRINLSTASPADLTSYTRFKAYYYKNEDVMDSNLWDLFQDDFKDFTISTFSQIKLRALQVLRDCLRSRGVFISKNTKRKTIAQTLFECLQEEEQHIWTLQDIQETFSENYNLKSQKLTRQLECSPISVTPPDTKPVTPDMTNLGLKISSGNQTPIMPAPCGSEIRIPLATLQETPTSSQEKLGPIKLVGYGREITNMAKFYTEEKKYGGTGEGLDHKLKIFYNICDRADVPEEAYEKAFPTMLKGLALDFYYTNELSNLSFQKVTENLRNYFQGPEFLRKNLGEWNSITLKKIMAENSNKSTVECLQLLIYKLRQLQHGLRNSLQTTEHFHDKLITACQGVPACRYAVSDPPDTIGALINKLQSSINAYEKENEQAEVLFTDRRYRNSNLTLREYNRHPAKTARTPHCYICGKESFRSWKHSDKEKDIYKSKFKNMFRNRLDSRPFDNDRFGQRLEQYMLECEREDEHSNTLDDRFNDTFNELIVDIDDDSQQASAHFISFGEINLNSATSTVMELSNRASHYTLTAYDDTKAAIGAETDPFSYNTNTISRYTSENFMGVMIDTGASKRSTAGYAQFLALQKDVDIKLDVRARGSVNVQFGIGNTSSIGSAI